MISYSLEYLVKLINQWHANPEGMASRVITSAIVGQGVFWLLGSDQIGLFMNPKLRMGRGPSMAGSSTAAYRTQKPLPERSRSSRS